ncbi:MAG: hypothetical protein J5J06_09765 [Phycisphaerae bacterium]|nr:hypothetical protein [Phycisphaerae bacterium]
MIHVLAALFTTGIELRGYRLLLLFPLCLSIAIVYKTTRCEDLREVPAAAGVLWITIVAGMFAIGLALWLLSMIMI